MSCKKTLLLLMMAASASLFAVAAKRDVKLVFWGAGCADLQRFIAEYDQLKTQPYDCFGIHINWTEKGIYYLGGMLWDNRGRYPEDIFEKIMLDADKLAEIVDRDGVEIFIRLYANPGRLDWFDDKQWDDFIYNWTQIVRVAKRAKAKGFHFDPEPYTPTRPFGYTGANGRSFAETSAMVRQRGAEFMQVLADEYPEAIFMTMGLWCWQWYFNAAYDTMSLEEMQLLMEADPRYGLLTAFSDGLLETAPEGMRIINASEVGYRLREPIEFLQLMRNQRGRGSVAERMVAPELRDKFRKHVEGGFGLYIDPFIGKENAVADFGKYLRTAIDVTDEYIWIWGDKGKFNPGGEDRPMYEELLPGILEEIARAKEDYYGTLGTVNLIKNPGFTDNADEYDNWLASWSKGHIDYEPTSGRSGGAVTMTDTVDSCWNQQIKVTPGEHYRVSVYCRKEGNVLPRLTVRWQGEDRKWQDEKRDTTYPFFSSDWEKGTVDVVVPQGAAYLGVVMYCGSAVSKPEGKAWFDDVEVYKYE